jgi:hypothetical protein
VPVIQGRQNCYVAIDEISRDFSQGMALLSRSVIDEVEAAAQNPTGCSTCQSPHLYMTLPAQL